MKITLLAGGGTVYVYPDVHGDDALAGRVAEMRAVLDVAYPADDTLVARIDEAHWPAMQADLERDGMEIVDTRGEAS